MFKPLSLCVLACNDMLLGRVLVSPFFLGVGVGVGVCEWGGLRLACVWLAFGLRGALCRNYRA